MFNFEIHSHTARTHTYIYISKSVSKNMCRSSYCMIKTMEVKESFEKELTETDVKQKLAIPTAFVQHIKNHLGGAPLKVADFSTGRVYEFVLATRQAGHMKPTFQSKGWLNFVKENRLIARDSIFFWKDTDRGDEQFYIRVTKDYFARSA